MQYAVREKDVAAEPVVTIRKHTSFAELPHTVNASLKTIASAVAPQGAWTARPPFAIYHNTPFRPDDVDVEIGVPINRAVTTPLAHELGSAHVAFTVHEGSYGSIGAAYDALFAWMVAHGKRPAGPPREIYLVGPDHAKDPKDFRTEIDVPIA